MKTTKSNKEKTFVIVCDTREQIPWKFSRKPMVNAKVAYGDYTIEGLEDSFAIERKRSTAEFAGNMSEPRFSKLLENLSQLKYKYIICEFSFDDVVIFPFNSGIPKSKMRKVRVSANWIIKYMSNILSYYNIPIIFAGSAENAERIAYSLMKEVVECSQTPH